MFSFFRHPSKLSALRWAFSVALTEAFVACGGVAGGNSTSIFSPDSGVGGTGGGSSTATSVNGSGGVNNTTTGGTTGTGGACNDCLPMYDLHWGMNGGMVIYADTSYLGPCRGYTHQRDYFANAAPPTCTQTLPGCPDRTMDRIIADTSDPGFTTALANHTLYGTDPRPVDGQVLRIGIGNDYIDIGTPCYSTPASCSTMPNAIVDLVTILQSVDQTELATAACKAVFGN